jgi:low temperature requirement protein LtrA
MRTEILVGILVLGILGFFLNPTHVLMPDSLNMMLVLVLLLGFLGFVGLFWREHASDERESIHMQKAGRLSFFVGATILVIGIVVQAVQHDIDPWLLYALAGMVLTKLLSRIFHSLRN